MDSTSNDMQGYDAIVAVTENSINGNFKLLFGKESGIRRKIDIDVPKLGLKLVGEIQPPKVRLRVDDSPRHAVLIIKIQKGTVTYYDGVGPAAEQKTMPISNWTVGFRVNLRMDDLGDRQIPKAVQDRIKNLKKGMFSVRQLFMVLQTADIASYDSSSTILPDSLTKDPEAKSFFDVMMLRYINQLSKNGDLILGYGIQVTNPNLTHPDAPSLPPTDLNFWVNQFRPGAGNPGPEPGLDTLSYLMMTEKRPMPSETPSWFGNWTRNKDEFGTVAINKSNFFDRFLLLQLAGTANLVTQIDKVGLEGSWAVQIETRVGGAYSPTPDGGEYKPTPAIVSFRNRNVDVEWSATHSSKVSAKASGSTIEIQGFS